MLWEFVDRQSKVQSRGETDSLVDPSSVRLELVARKSNGLHVALLELRLEPRDLSELSGADGSEVGLMTAKAGQLGERLSADLGRKSGRTG